MMVFSSFIPSLLLFSNAPTFFALWFPLRLLRRCISMPLYCYLDEKLYSIYQRGVLFFYEHYAQTKIVLYGDTECLESGKENVLYMSNHQSAVDWVITDMLAARQGGIGRIRYILKEELKYVPLYGLYFHEHGCIYVNRRQFQMSKTVDQLNAITKNNNKCWMVIFPEGTRISTKKQHLIEGSKEFACKQGLTPLQYHLTPRVRGSELTLQSLGGYLDAVYDVTILYSHCLDEKGRRKDSPQLFSFFNQRNIIHIHLRRIPMRDVPTAGGDKFRHWLHQRFEEKDKMLSEGLRKDLIDSMDVFGPGGRESRLSLWETAPCLLFFTILNLLLWSHPIGRALYLGICFISSGLGIVYAHFWI